MVNADRSRLFLLWSINDDYFWLGGLLFASVEEDFNEVAFEQIPFLQYISSDVNLSSFSSIEPE